MTPKKRYQLLLAGLVIFLLLAYQLAFGKTWALRQDIQRLEAQKQAASTAAQDIQQYQTALAELDQQQQHPAFSPNLLFDLVTEFCQKEGLDIKAMPAAQVFQEEDLKILHHPIQVAGNYLSMVKLLYELEQVKRLGRIASVQFELLKNYQSRQKELVATIALQNIQSTEPQ